jgi:hypothetical protein
LSGSVRKTENLRGSLLAEGHLSGRRAFLSATLASLSGLLIGCGAPAQKPSPPKNLLPPPLLTSRLSALLPLAGLKWLVMARPRDIASIPWLIPPIGMLVTEERLTRFAETTGLDLRQIPEAVIATYASEWEEDATIYLVRHTGAAKQIERAFRERLSGSPVRSIDRPDLVRLSGRIGRHLHSFAAFGRDVVGFQQGGDPTRGPLRIAALYAMGKLKRSPTVLAEEPLQSLAARFGEAPARAFALGPFEGELAAGARGLLAAATAIGAAARPSARDGISLSIAVAGDFSQSGPSAERALAAAWNELANSSFGHLLGLDEPLSAPLTTHGEGAVALAVELEPLILAKGLRDATASEIWEIMR